MRKTIILPLLFALPLLGWGAMYCVTKDQKKLALAKEFLLNGCYSQCHEKLEEIHSKRLKLPLPLYKGYLALMQNNYKEAGRFFEESKKIKGSSSLLGLETTLAMTLCDYYQKNLVEANALLAEIDEQNKKNQWFKLIHGFIAFRQKDYKTAIRSWNDLDYTYIEEEALASNWGGYCFKRLFSEEPFELQLARALIEENDFLLARELLERSRQEISLPYAHSLTSMYLGYSYLKEAKQSIDNPLSYYKLAAFYFERTALASLAKEHREFIIAALFQSAKIGIQEGSLAVDSLASLVLPLQKWQCVDELKHLSEELVEKICYSALQDDLAFASEMQPHFGNALFHHMVAERATETILGQMNQGRLELFPKYLALMKALVTHTAHFQQKCVQHVLSHLDHVILQDHETLPQLRLYLELLENLDEMEDKRSYLTIRLVEQAKVFWQEKGKEIKATQLMQLAFQLSPNKVATKESIESYLCDLFDSAEASNLVERLNYIYDALLAFNLRIKNLNDPSILANHLADAHYRFQTKEFSCSKILSSWVLKLDPQNQEALKLLGLNYYHLGNYHEAIIVLQKLFVLDEDAHQALVISEVFSSSESFCPN